MQNTDFQELRKKIFANGKIDENDVSLLREALLADQTMTREKGNFLFDIKDNTSRSNQCDAFKTLFVEAITMLLLDNDTTVNCEDIFRQHYKNVIHFHGEHRLNRQVIEEVLVPLIKEITNK